jgi:hypothetical protein
MKPTTRALLHTSILGVAYIVLAIITKILIQP